MRFTLVSTSLKVEIFGKRHGHPHSTASSSAATGRRWGKNSSLLMHLAIFMAMLFLDDIDMFNIGPVGRVGVGPAPATSPLPP